MSMEDLRLVVIGKSGAGKSSTANTILGNKLFRSELCGSAVTQKCQVKSEKVNGRLIKIVDTPGLFDSERDEKSILKDVVRSVLNSKPGPHVILLVLQIGRITNEDIDTINTVLKHFGEGLEKYVMVIFTRFDDWKRDNNETSFDKYLQTLPKKAENFFTEICKNRCIPIDNTLNGQARQEQVKTLIKTIDRVVTENGGNFYSNEDMDNANKQMKKLEIEAKKRLEEDRNRLEAELNKKFESLTEEMKRQHKEDLLQLVAAIKVTDQRDNEGSVMNFVLNGLTFFAAVAGQTIAAFTSQIISERNLPHGDASQRAYCDFVAQQNVRSQPNQINSYGAQLNLRTLEMLNRIETKNDTAPD